MRDDWVGSYQTTTKERRLTFKIIPTCYMTTTNKPYLKYPLNVRRSASLRFTASYDLFLDRRFGVGGGIVGGRGDFVGLLLLLLLRLFLFLDLRLVLFVLSLLRVAGLVNLDLAGLIDLIGLLELWGEG